MAGRPAGEGRARPGRSLSPAELADAVTAIRLATAAPVSAGPVLFERLDWRPFGIRPVLPIAATQPPGEHTRLDSFRAEVAREVLAALPLADSEGAGDGVALGKIADEGAHQRDGHRRGLQRSLNGVDLALRTHRSQISQRTGRPISLRGVHTPQVAGRAGVLTPQRGVGCGE